MASSVPSATADSQPGDLSAATATAAIARTKDLVNWERLPDSTKSQQRNVVLHPEFVVCFLYSSTRWVIDMVLAVVSAGLLLMI